MRHNINDILFDVWFTKHEWYIMRALIAAWPGKVTRDDLIWAVWGERADGGPDAADTAIRVNIKSIRAKLAHTDVELPNLKDGNNQYGGYFLRLKGSE